LSGQAAAGVPGVLVMEGSMSERIVIVGAGHAGATLAATLRQKGHDGTVTLVSAESHHPYHRPPLSKDMLVGTTGADRILLRPPQFYPEKGIDLLTGRRVAEVDSGSRTLALEDGGELGYEALVIATGTRARVPPVPGIDLAGVHTLRTLTDSQTMGERLAPGSRLVILGAGYIGLEVAAVARDRGVDVTVVERADRVLARVASPPVSHWVRQRHESRGVRFVTGATATRLAGNGTVSGVVLDDGSTLPADTVLVGVGAEPVVDLAQAMGLSVSDGIDVDETLRTSDSRVFAIGDCASHPCHFTERPRRLESVQNAQDQARAVASLLAGEGDVRYDSVPWFWSDQGADKLQSAGLPDAHDDLEVLGDPASDRFTVVHRRNGVIVASESVNDPRNHMLSRRWIRDGNSATGL
jgi:3-phenylpropionate/trans-cinnamate dioxygenase ferredoxin reductase subunit